MPKEFAHEADAHRYTLRSGGQLLSKVDYAINRDQISFTHTYTDPSQRGKGLAGEIVEFAVNDVEATSTRRIVPMCWYVGLWFEQHPERAALLSRTSA